MSVEMWEPTRTMLLLTLTMTVHGDIGDHGDNIIMQTNIETILIMAELSPIKGQLISLMKKTKTSRQQL